MSVFGPFFEPFTLTDILPPFLRLFFVSVAIVDEGEVAELDESELGDEAEVSLMFVSLVVADEGVEVSVDSTGLVAIERMTVG